MSDRREEILRQEYFKYYRPSFISDDRTAQMVNKALCIKEETDAIKNAMDENGKQMCLELLQYMADNSITLSLASLPEDPLFSWKGKLLTKDELFENFL